MIFMAAHEIIGKQIYSWQNPLKTPDKVTILMVHLNISQ